MPKDDDGLPDAAFMPPPHETARPVLELDPEWVAERAAKQAAAAASAPKPRRQVAGVVVAVLLVAAVAAACAWIVLKT